MKRMNRDEYEKARRLVRMFTRTRDDLQAMRKAMDNRIGLKANGKDQDLKNKREFRIWDCLTKMSSLNSLITLMKRK